MPTTKGISGALEKELGGSGTSAGTLAGGKFASAFKKVLGAAAIGKFLKDTITEGADLQQNLGGTEAVFADFAKDIQATAKTAYKNMGTSASEYMATANKMGSLFQGSGLSQQRSLELTTKAMQRAADVASVMGIDTLTALDSIAGAAKGNFTMMDNLGVAMNATTLQAYAKLKGIKFDWKKATNADKAELAMKMFFEKTEQYAGNFARESEETISGSLGAMKAAFKDVLGNLTLGQDITPSLNAFMQTTLTFVKGNLLPALGNILKTLPSMLGTVLSETFTELPNMAQGATGFIVSLADEITAALPALIPAASDMITTMVTSLTSPESIVSLVNSAARLIAALAQGLIESIPILLASIPTIISNIVTSINQSQPILCDTVVQILQMLWAMITDYAGRLWSLVSPHLNQFTESVRAFFTEKIPQIIENIGNFFAQLPEKIAYGLGLALGKLISWGAQALNWAITNTPRIIESIGNFFAQLPSKLWNHLLNALASIKNWFANATNTAITETPRIANQIVNGFRSLPSKLLEIGRNIVAGLWNGIKGRWGKLVSDVSGLIGGFIGGIKKGLGIASPSKVTKGIGEYVTEGLALGITGKAGLVKSAIDDITRITTGTMNSNLSVSSALNGTPAGSGSTGNDEVVSAIYTLLDAIRNIGLYLDGDTLVGGIIDKADRMLGDRQMQAERGVI